MNPARTCVEVSMDTAFRAETYPSNSNGKAFHPVKGPLPPLDHSDGPPGEIATEVATDTDPRRHKVSLLRSVPLFADLTPPVLDRVAERSIWRDYRRRQAVHLPGDPADGVYVVSGGRVKISRLSEDGREATLLLVEREEIFGEECLLDATTRETIAEVVEPARILRCPREELVPALRSHPAFAMAVARLMSGRRRAMESRLEEMVFKTVRARLAALLARLARSHGKTSAGGILLDLALAHQDLAGQIGSTRETTTLTLNQFRRGGLLRIHHCQILIRDLAGLEAIA